jgi:hypothetical protein
MSAFYDQASLVVVPSGYKSGKIYAQKPLTTDGQLTFTRASTATRVNASGLIESVASGVPRLDYLGSSCPKILLEPQRSNLITYSQEFDNAAWTKGASTITANSVVSPDGTTNADAIVDTATNAEHVISRAANVGVTASVPVTSSVFLKSGTQQFAMLRSFGVASQQYFCVVVDLNAGTITKTQAGTTTTGTSATITNYGNGWYRVTATATFTGTQNNQILHLVNSANPTIGSFGESSYLGNGTNSIFAWGFQLEQASYATSYIPTLGTSVTRVADAATKSGIGSLIGTEFTLFFDGFDTVGGASTRYMALKGTGGTYANALIIESNSSNQVAVYLGNNSSSAVFNAISGALTNGQRMKFAIACKNSDIAFYLNGSLVASQSSGTIPTMTDLYLGSYVDYIDNYCLVNQAIIFENRLTNAQLAELTTL